MCDSVLVRWGVRVSDRFGGREAGGVHVCGIAIEVGAHCKGVNGVCRGTSDRRLWVKREDK